MIIIRYRMIIMRWMSMIHYNFLLSIAVYF